MPSDEMPTDDTNPGDLGATIDFLLEADKLKGVERRNWLADGSRRENTAEHSWHLGIAAMVLSPFATERVDVGRAVCMALVHDIVEIDAGDTFAYDQSEAAATKREREEAAADRLFGVLPEAMGEHFRNLWEEYERGDTPEARFVMAVDRSAPMLLNITEGGSAWREFGINRTRVIDRNGPHVKPAVPALWAHLLAMLDAAAASGLVDPR